MTKKIYRSILLVSLLTFLCCMVLFLGISYDYFNTKISDELKSEAYFLKAGVEADGTDYLSKIRADNRVTWIDADGKVLFDTTANSETLENHSDRTEFVEAKNDGAGESHRYSETMSQKTYYYALLLEDGTVIRVSSVQYTVWVLLLSMINPIIVVLVLVLVLSIVLAVLLSKKIVKPINEIDIENPDIDEDYDELSPLLHKISRQNELIERQMNDLRTRQEEFRTITENMSEGLILIDDKTEVLSFNKSALAQLGAKTAVYGTSVLTLNRSEAFCHAVDDALKGVRSEPLLEIGGKVYQLFANPVAVDKKVSGAVLVILDVTEKDQRDEMRREFTSNVSHELKTPLTSIFGISEIMMNGIVKPEDMRSFAKNIYDESGRLISLVNDIIKLSQLDESSVSMEKTDTDIYEIAGEAVKRLSKVAADRKVTLTLSGKSVHLNGIPTIISEMVYNLTDNGIKYNKEGGSVIVNVSGEDGHPVLTVSDTGIGIPKEHLDRVFERFYRVDKSHSKSIGGTGLGLSIVKHGALYHGADIKIDSNEGKGTTVTVKF